MNTSNKTFHEHALGHDEAWQLLESAAISEDPALAIMAGRTAAERLTPVAQQRLVRLIATVVGHPEPQVRLQVLGRCAQLSVADTEGVLLPQLMARLNSPLSDEVRAAAGAVFAIAQEQNAPAVARAVSDLLSNRRSLDIVVYVLSFRLATGRSTVPLARHVLDVLRSDVLTATCQVRIAVEVLTPTEMLVLLEQLTASNGLHADSLGAAVDALSNPSHLHYSAPADLDALERELSLSRDGQIRRFALTALQQAAERGGWTAERIAKLEAYRLDSSPLVSAAAQFTFPNVEE